MAGALGVFQDLNQIGSTLAFYSQDNITAWAGGGKTNAVQLTAQINRVTVVATAADSVKLPPAQPGLVIWLANADSTDAMQVFGQGSDTINGVATGTGVSQAAGGALLAYVCATSGAWISIASSAAAITSGTIDNVVINNSSVGLTTALGGNFTAVNVSGNLAAGNFAVTGVTALTGNMTGGNISIAGASTLTGNTTAGNVTGANITISGNTNVSAGNLVINGNTGIFPITFQAGLATGAVTQAMHVVARPLIVGGVKLSFANASTSGTFMLEKLTGNVAPGSGTTMLTGTMDLAGANNNVVVGTMNATAATLAMTANDRIGAVFAGTMTNLLGLNITVIAKPT